MNKPELTIDAVDAVLPQTQCGLCDYGGCRPYAKAIVEQGETIDRCPPGGVAGLLKLAQLTNQEATPYIAKVKAKEQPIRLARIDEDVCIGCTKCIAACPVDAIMGASKQMHTVLTAECSGCELCVAPCPVDCIEMVTVCQHQELMPQQHEQRAKQYRHRFEQRNERLLRQKAALTRKHQLAKVAHKAVSNKRETLAVRKAAIAAAVKREQMRLKKRNNEES